MIKRILITPGEPAGIGPDITIEMTKQHWPIELCVVADEEMLLQRAQQLSLPLTLLPFNIESDPEPTAAHTLKIIPIKCDKKVVPGKLDTQNAPYVLATLKEAAQLCMAKSAQAIVTGPINKGLMNDAGISFTGHTEFFKDYAHVPHTVMLFVVGTIMKVALVTTHLPLKNIPQALTPTLLKNTLNILIHSLKNQFKLAQPRILVCGMNPHAGEGGHLGREDIDIIAPIIAEFKRDNFSVSGPLPADTIFTPESLAKADAIVAMYHDQALPVVKYAGFGEAVNVTLGLPFIRTSVDHGTALAIAGSKSADAGSMQKAIELAMVLASEQPW